ncbi:MAG: hypothetical protein M3Z20_08410 [Chloroflexota bacterium]|nr:hypothetical protein [Chloroflexota bacterium]
MNPYLATALAMCAIVLISLAGTAYLAAVFNRRAKADMQARLDPLAAATEGTADVEEARVDGRYNGQIAVGRVSNAPGGFGRLFHVELVDSAGGEKWEWSSLPQKKPPALIRTFEGDPALEQRLEIDFPEVAKVVPNDEQERFGFIYDPDAGMMRLTREMRTRLDIPDAETFLRQLAVLQNLGEANRRAQAGVPLSAQPPLSPDDEPQAGPASA